MKKQGYIICFLLVCTVLTTHGSKAPDSLSVALNEGASFTMASTSSIGFHIEEPSDLLTESITISSDPGDSLQHFINQGRAAIDKVRALGNYITSIDEATQFELPVGIKKAIPGLTWDLAIHAIRLRPTHAELDLFLEFEIPQNGQKLMFMGRGIKYTKKGGIVGDARIELLGDYGINFSGDKVQLILKGALDGTGTYATIDCDGFREMGIDAEVKFSRDVIRPEDANGAVTNGNVVATFEASILNWNDLIVQLDLPRFQLSSAPGFSFSTRDVIFDFSDVRNAPNLQFPEGYQSTQMLPDNPNLWRGFYMREMVVQLPPEFKRKGDSARPTFVAQSVIIDNAGITGIFSGSDVLTLQQGDMNGWAFSLDAFRMELRASQLVEATFNGEIVIPVAKEETPFEYNALISSGGNYLFTVSPAENMEFDVFKAGKVEIYEASYLDIAIVDRKFRPKANLHGRMSINGKLSEGGQGVELANITFEDLQIQSVKPYIKVGNFSFGSEAAQQKMAGFPIGITDIGLRNISDTEVGLDFTLKLNLVGEDAGSFAADAGLTVIGKMDTERGWQSWKYKDIAVHEIGVDIDGGAFKFNGRLIFYRNDAVYGDGFNGTVKAEFKPGIKVSATAIFGSVNSMRYWYADAMAELPSGIPIFTGVGIYGFGGGAYYRMKMDNEGLGSRLGRTASGVVYVPHERSGLGLKAVVSFGSHPKPEAFNGDVTFEIAFFQGGGIRYIAFGGNGYLVTPGLDLKMDKLKEATGKMADKAASLSNSVSGATRGLLDADSGGANSMSDIFGAIGEKAGEKGSLSAHVHISYDFENRVLHGNFEMYVNVAGGIIKGVGAGGRAGWAVLHFAPHEWYIYVGTPDDRIGISVGVGPIRANATSYFMVGTKILGSPPPPPEVSRILGGVDLDYMKDLNEIGTGGGFAFGAALSISTGDLSFLMFYARFDAGAGFDIMLKDYGDLRCAGSNKRIGINGWYANGQAYAFFEGSIGIRVKVFGVRKNIEILSIGAAAVLQAKLPNPFWMRGIVGGYFSVLGGVVKGNCKFQVTIGEECVIVRDPNAILDDIKVISELTPANGETNVSVFTTPQAVFNMKVDTEFEMMDEVTNTRRKFRIKLDHFKAEIDKVAVTATTSWNADQDVLALNPYEVLPTHKDVVLSVQVSFEELISGRWTKVQTNGVPVTQSMQHTVTSGVAPDYIPHENIEYSYPVIGQMNYYKNEYLDGYVKLKQAQPYLFRPGSEWKQRARLKAQDGSYSVFDFTYTYSTNLVTYKLPSTLKNSQVYAFELINFPANAAQAIDRNVTEVTNKITSDDESVDMEIKSKEAEGSISELQEKSILTYYLRTSAYNTFSQKVDNVTIPNPFQWETANGVSKLYSNINGLELFDSFETDPSRSTSLIVFEAKTDNSWYNDIIYPLMYEGYPMDGKISLSNRDVTIMGVPPVKSVFFNEKSAYSINQEAPDAYTAYSGYESFQYYFPVEIGNDYLNMRAHAANASVYGGTTERMAALLKASWRNVLPNHTYNVKASYVLPGTRKVTSEKNIPLYFTIYRAN